MAIPKITFQSAWVLAILVVAIPFVGLRAPRPNLARAHERQFSGAGLAGARVPGFVLHREGAPFPDARGAAYSADPSVKPHLWGTYVQGDSFVGRLSSIPFVLGTPRVYLPVTGYPTSAGNRLALEVFGVDEPALTYQGPDPREQLQVWEIDASRWRGRTARLLLVDASTSGGGWLAVGAPILSDAVGAAARWAPDREPTYGRFALATLVVTTLLLLPGTWLRRRRRGTPFSPTWVLLPVPGLLLLSGYGVLLWITGAGASWVARAAYLGFNMLLAADLAFRVNPTAEVTDPEDCAWPLGVWASAVLLACCTGLSPLPVAAEFDEGTTLPGRMVAPPPDHTIPFRTAAFFFRGKHGPDANEVYFGDWAVTSRGPLVPLAVTTLFCVFRDWPRDPPVLDVKTWPAGRDGAHLARILGWLTNALVVLGGWRLLGALGAARETRRFGLLWLALSPLVSINVVFLWPKLLATYFLLLAAADLLERRPVHAGLWAALAWLSHPVGALYFPALLLLHAQRAWLRPGWWPAIAAFVGTVLLVMSPWLAYKLAVSHPDIFMRYPLGDGRGPAFAESWETWLEARRGNVVLTLVPCAFVASDLMTSWVGHPLSGGLRWAVQYAKTLPGHLGMAFVLPTYLGFVIGRAAGAEVSSVRRHLVVFAFALMIVFWGFSSDGLGRNCLEPLSALVIVVTVATWKTEVPKWARAALVVVAFEGVWLAAVGFAGDRSFSPGRVPLAAVVLACIHVAATAGLTGLGLAAAATRPPPPAPMDDAQPAPAPRPPAPDAGT